MMRFLMLIALGFALILLPLCIGATQVKPGADILIERQLALLDGKRVGLITNHTGRLSGGEFLVDVLLEKGINVVALFGPEHGIRGEADAGEKVGDAKDAKTGIPVFSLYGKTRKPTDEMLANVDVLVYDIQDVGTRFYTYISTMGLSMEAAAERGIPFVVLDRPNPLGGDLLDGPVMEDSLASFVGMYPIPIVYGLTCGELAQMINGEHWLRQGVSCSLTVVRMNGWTRSMRWIDTGLRWIPPSPNIPTPDIAMIYPATCIFEATNISEGRGTSAPFATLGAPFIDSERLLNALNAHAIPGVEFRSTSFTPISSKFDRVRCEGIQVTITDPSTYQPTLVSFNLLCHLRQLFPGEFLIRRASFNRLMGSANVYDMLMQGSSPSLIRSNWLEDTHRFKSLSRRYHLYTND